MVQQRQPFSSTTTESELLAKSFWSRPTSPNSLTTTTVLASSGERSAALMRVVLPLPRKPVTKVTGILLWETDWLSPAIPISDQNTSQPGSPHEISRSDGKLVMISHPSLVTTTSSSM